MKSTRSLAAKQTDSARASDSVNARSSREIGYANWDAVPRRLRQLVAEHSKLPAPPREMDQRERRRVMNARLRRLDIDVLVDLFSVRRLTGSCWRSCAAAAEALGVTTRSVQQSWRRLEAHGFIEHVPVETPDPDDPRNRTGWRFRFLFVDGASPSKPVEPLPGSEAGFDPSPKPVSPPPAHPVSPNVRGTGIQRELKKTSSSQSARDDDNVSSSFETNPEDLKDAVEVTRQCFGDAIAATLEANPKRVVSNIKGRWDLYQSALVRAWDLFTNGRKRRESLHDPVWYAAQIVRTDFLLNGLPPDQQAAVDRYMAMTAAKAQKKAQAAAAEAQAAAETRARDEALVAGIETATAVEVIERIRGERWKLYLAGGVIQCKADVFDPVKSWEQAFPAVFRSRCAEIRDEIQAVLEQEAAETAARLAAFEKPTPKPSAVDKALAPQQATTSRSRIPSQPKAVEPRAVYVEGTPEQLAAAEEEKRRQRAAKADRDRMRAAEVGTHQTGEAA